METKQDRPLITFYSEKYKHRVYAKVLLTRNKTYMDEIMGANNRTVRLKIFDPKTRKNKIIKKRIASIFEIHSPVNHK